MNSVTPSAVDGAATRACTNQKRLTAYGALDQFWPVGQCYTDREYRGAAGRGTSVAANYFQEWTLESGRHGVRFANAHVAGDRSVANLLGMIEQIQKEKGSEATKGWAFDHCFMVNPADLPRAGKLGLTFSCAPKYVESAGAAD